MLSQDVCLSVRLSHTGIKTVTNIFKLSSPSGSHTIQVFQHQKLWHYYDWDPLVGAPNPKAIAIFDQDLALP